MSDRRRDRPGRRQRRQRFRPVASAPALLLAAFLTVLLAGGCSGLPSATVSGTPETVPITAPAPADTAGLPASKPLRLTIPSISVDTGLIDLGLQADGTMEVPADGSTAGWYVNSPTPGELGPAVLAAHVDWKGAKGVFYDLSRTKVGDDIEVRRTDGRTLSFTVRCVEQYSKQNFPTDEVYGNVDSPQLRLITCGGSFDHTARSYRDNIVVYAELAG